MPPPPLPSLRDFMRRSRVLSLCRSLLRALPPPARPSVVPAFRAHAAERSPAVIAARIAEAEAQLQLVRSHVGGARGGRAGSGLGGGGAAGAGVNSERAAEVGGWPWERA